VEEAMEISSPGASSCGSEASKLCAIMKKTRTTTQTKTIAKKRLRRAVRWPQLEVGENKSDRPPVAESICGPQRTFYWSELEL
jgi:hypothetical protein